MVLERERAGMEMVEPKNKETVVFNMNEVVNIAMNKFWLNKFTIKCKGHRCYVSKISKDR